MITIRLNSPRPERVVNRYDLREFLVPWRAQLVEVDDSEPGRVRVSIRFISQREGHFPFPEHPQEVLAQLREDLLGRVTLGTVWSVSVAGEAGPYRSV